MIRLGMLDFDTSHVVEFARRLNHRGIAEDQWVDGATIVVACAGQSQIMPERIPPYRKEIEELGIPLAARPEDMIGQVDGMLIESQQGSVHWERARSFLEAGLPCFIDKPFTCGLADARKLAELAARKNVPIFSASSLRYAPELVDFLSQSGHGPIQGALAYSPATLNDGNPGLYHYGIHAVEILYTLMGPGCERVSCIQARDADLVSAQWRDGRVAGIRGNRGPRIDYGCVVFTEQGVYSLPLDTRYIYRELLKRIVEMFKTGKAPLDITVTVEMMAFMEAALKSAKSQGAPQEIQRCSTR
jgi:virulence factor